jgi:hypothetical protein
MPKMSIIQPRRWVRQLQTISTFAQRCVANTTCSGFVLLLICHWRWIWWRGNPTLESAVRRRLSSIIWEKKNLWVSLLGAFDPLEESAHILVSKMQSRLRCCEKCFPRSKISNNTHTLIATTIVSTSGHRQVS